MKVNPFVPLALASAMLASMTTFAGVATTAWAQAPKMKMTTEIPKSITTPDKVKTSLGALEFFDGVPTEKTTEAVYDYLDRARAVEVFLDAMPVVSMYQVIKGQADAGASEWLGEASVIKELATNGHFITHEPGADKYNTYEDKRLDWILITKDMEFVNYQVLPDTLSDHAMVIADIRFKINSDEVVKSSDPMGLMIQKP